MKQQSDSISQHWQSLKEVVEDMRAIVNSTLHLDAFMKFLDRIIEKQTTTLHIKHNKKLCQLYGGTVPDNHERSKVLNISDQTIDEDILSILQLGMNCHLKGKYCNLKKKIELEKLYEDITRKEAEGEVIVVNEEELKCNMKRLGLKGIVDHNKDLITKAQNRKIKEFRSNDNIIIRKADKSSTFVIMNTQEYKKQLDDLLQDRGKFRRTRKDTTDDIKSEINDIICLIKHKY